MQTLSVVFRPAAAGLLECVHVLASLFWEAGPLVEKRCEDASHSQSTSRHGGQCEMPWTHSALWVRQLPDQVNRWLNFWLRRSRPVESTI